MASFGNTFFTNTINGQNDIVNVYGELRAQTLVTTENARLQGLYIEEVGAVIPGTVTAIPPQLPAGFGILYWSPTTKQILVSGVGAPPP